jgi:hypothetical protein
MTTTIAGSTKGFRVNAIIQKQEATRKRRVQKRLDRFNFPNDLSQPMLRATKPRFELAERAVGTSYGGIALVHDLVRQLGLAKAIDERVHLFKFHLPYHESDHVLNLAYNALCAGTCLEDLELRRQDEAYMNALGAERIPDPTTAGDFCRRFTRSDLEDLQAAIDVARRQVWRDNRLSSSLKRGSKPMARRSKQQPSASRASISITRECGVTIRWCSHWPIRAKCCDW